MAETTQPPQQHPIPAPQPTQHTQRPYGNQGGRGGQSRGPRERRQSEAELAGFKETVVALNRVTKVVKGGKRFSFSALVVLGDQKGKIGIGLGKANEVQAAIQKGSRQAQRDAFQIAVVEGTIPHEVVGHFGAGKVWMRPAGEGTGVIAGGGVRSLLEAAGIKNILTKSLGSSNPFSMLYAAVEAVKQLKTKEEILKLRGRA